MVEIPSLLIVCDRQLVLSQLSHLWFYFQNSTFIFFYNLWVYLFLLPAVARARIGRKKDFWFCCGAVGNAPLRTILVFLETPSKSWAWILKEEPKTFLGAGRKKRPMWSAKAWVNQEMAERSGGTCRSFLGRWRKVDEQSSRRRLCSRKPRVALVNAFQMCILYGPRCT